MLLVVDATSTFTTLHWVSNSILNKLLDIFLNFLLRSKRTRPIEERCSGHIVEYLLSS